MGDDDNVNDGGAADASGGAGDGVKQGAQVPSVADALAAAVSGRRKAARKINKSLKPIPPAAAPVVADAVPVADDAAPAPADTVDSAASASVPDDAGGPETAAAAEAVSDADQDSGTRPDGGGDSIASDGEAPAPEAVDAVTASTADAAVGADPAVPGVPADGDGEAPREDAAVVAAAETATASADGTDQAAGADGADQMTTAAEIASVATEAGSASAAGSPSGDAGVQGVAGAAGPVETGVSGVETSSLSEYRQGQEAPAVVEEPVVPDTADLPPAELRAAVESLLFVSTKPLSVARLANCLPGTSAGYLEGFLAGLAARYDHERRGWELLRIANGWQLLTRKELHPWVRQLDRKELPTKLTKGALETLAIVAYKQPIARGAIEDIRGVQCGPVLRQLMDMKLVQVTGRDDNLLGRPLLYGTTEQFLQRFGLGGLNDLPAEHEFGA